MARIEDLLRGELARHAELASQCAAREEKGACADGLGRIAWTALWNERLDCELDGLPGWVNVAGADRFVRASYAGPVHDDGRSSKQQTVLARVRAGQPDANSAVMRAVGWVEANAQVGYPQVA